MMNRWYCPIKLFEYCEDRIWVRVSRLSAKNFLGRPGRSSTPFQAILKELGKRVLIVPISACGPFALGTREPMGIDRGGPGEMARRPEHGARPWRALSSDDPSKIERWHQTLKNRILLENYYLPGDLEAQIEAFVVDYNHLRYHESIGNLTPTDVYFGRGQTILIERERIKRQTIANRRLLHRRQAA